MFRKSWLSDWRARSIDAICHLTLALLIPGHWWFQYVPDMLVPVIWLWSFKTNAFLPKDSAILIAHKLLHDLRFMALVTCFLVLIEATSLKWLTVHWFFHLVVDSFTHEKWNELNA